MASRRSRPPQPLAPHGIPGHLVEFVEALRGVGIAVGPSETVDAGRVLTVLGLGDREALREGLACAVLRRADHRDTYDAMFDLWWPAAHGARTVVEDEVDPEDPDRVPPEDIEAMREALINLLGPDSDLENFDDRLAAMIARIVEAYGRYNSSRGPSYSAYQAVVEGVDRRATGDAGAVADGDALASPVQPGPGVHADVMAQAQGPVQEGLGGDGAAVAQHHAPAGFAEDGGVRGDEAAGSKLHGFLGHEPRLHLRLPGLRPGPVPGFQGEVQPGHPGQAALVLLAEGLGVAHGAMVAGAGWRLEAGDRRYCFLGGPRGRINRFYFGLG